jgi:hypothetical protein
MAATKKLTLSDALALVSRLESALEDDNTGELESVYDDADILNSSGEQFRDAVDRRIKADYALKYLIRMAREIKEQWTSKLRTLEKAHESFRQNTMWHMSSHPDTEFRGTLGRLTMQKNGGKPAFKLKFLTAKISDLITDEDIFKHEIPEDCYEKVTVNILRKDRLSEHVLRNSNPDLEDLSTQVTTVLADNKAGKITQGRHLKVRL